MAPSADTILLVDDEPQVTDALKRALRREPYEFLTATSGAEAQQILERQHVDVVVSDEQMPGMSGSELLSKVRRKFPHTIRIILSGQANLESAVRAINEGEVYRFLLKPCIPADLILTVRQALRVDTDECGAVIVDETEDENWLTSLLNEIGLAQKGH